MLYCYVEDGVSEVVVIEKENMRAVLACMYELTLLLFYKKIKE